MRRLFLFLFATLAVSLTTIAVLGPDEVRGRLEALTPVAGEDGDTDPQPAEPVGPLRYVALGDSLVTGFAAPEGYPEHVAAELEEETGRPVELDVAAQAGWTTSRVVELVDAHDELRASLSEAELVTISVGSNDLMRTALDLGGECTDEACARPAMEGFLERLEDLLAEVGDVTDAEVVVTDLYDPFPQESEASAALAMELRGEVNAGLAAAAGAEGFAVAPVAAAFHGPEGDEEPGQRNLLAFDGIHPSRAGHEAIAQAVIAARRQ